MAKLRCPNCGKKLGKKGKHKGDCLTAKAFTDGAFQGAYYAEGGDTHNPAAIADKRQRIGLHITDIRKPIRLQQARIWNLQRDVIRGRK